jgi:hypothetical protein
VTKFIRYEGGALKPEILLVSQTSAQCPEFVASVARGTGLSLTHKLDRSSVKFTDDAKLLVSLTTFGGCIDELDAFMVMRGMPEMYMRFLQYTFLIVGDEDTIFTLRAMTQLTVIIHPEPQRIWALATGSLDQWKDAIINGLITHHAWEYQLLLDKLMLKFEGLGLSLLWDDYQKKWGNKNKDTFLLEHKS